ncbi:MAG: hypothetical protein O4805_10385 [Trichodesmium sp. St16_bin2-tuft]|jgi:hypothetical protein|nr:hypothetical protein [Trichodesmium sp. St18_bin1]MDE5087526.1 hypothetical protein [Trichodesmium sp. St16_bin2-tuft]MDE5121061.1 hypothetical protein [Trichodesmium sp. St19_bin1]
MASVMENFSLDRQLKNTAIAVELNYQYSFKILKKYNDFAEEGITNLKKKKCYT